MKRYSFSRGEVLGRSPSLFFFKRGKGKTATQPLAGETLF
jgi:hypothetical protein